MTSLPQARRNRLAGLAAGTAAILLYAALDLLHARAYGPLATQGPDLWFYALVARGWESLSFLDATRWLVLPAAHMAPERALAFLASLAAACNAGVAFLVAARLHALLPADRDESPGFLPRFAAGLFFALLPHNVALSVMSFTHFTVGQLFLVAALQDLLPWLDAKKPRPGALGIACLAEAAVIGPEGVCVAAWVLLLTAWRRARGSLPPAALRAAPIVAVGLILLTWAFYEPAFRLWARAVLATRGIDLLWQRAVLSGDLLPLGFSLATVFHGMSLVWIGLAAWNLRRGSKPLAWLVLWLAVLSLRVFRPAFLLQVAGLLLFLRTLGESRHPWRWLGGGVAILAALACLPLSAPVHSGFSSRAAREVGRRMSESSRVACSPTYGFFLEAWTRRHATTTMHRRNPIWQELAASPPRQCARRMKEAGIGILWITTHDFRWTGEGYWSSSGLQETLQPLDDAAFQDSVVVRLALGRDLLPLRLATRPGTGHERVWCLTAE